MNSRRYFSGSERTALYLAADGRCENCGAELEPGWHADHVQPHSRDGDTDVINGQALCPKCNQEKGNKVADELRRWQQEAREQFFARSKKDFLVTATPAAGKTWFALTLAKDLLDERTARLVAVVVPTDALRLQWANKAEAAGLSLIPVSDGDDYGKAGYDGCVVTYQQLAMGAGADLLRRMTRTPTVAILDEVHHAGDNRSWGDALQHALERATVRLALTGTPWRRKADEPIPFVTYNDAGQVQVDYAYEYGEAVADGVCRRIEFHAYDGEARWIDCGTVVSANLGADLTDEDTAMALNVVLDPQRSWMPALLREACAALDELRAEVPDAGGLVVAHDRWRAQKYAALLEGITGEKPALAISDNPDQMFEAKDEIGRFSAKGCRQRWIVAVKMVSEGVDIPRLAVGVYAAKTRTPLFFRQVVGRFVRVRPGEPEFNARLYIPAISALAAHAREIEEELRHQLDLETEHDEKAAQDAASRQRTFELREPLSASDAVFDRAIFGGEEADRDTFAQAEQECQRLGIPARYAANLIPLLRERSEPVADVTVTPKPPGAPRHRREKMLRQEINALAGKVAHQTRFDKKEVNAQILSEGFPSRSKASVEELESIRAFLIEWLGSL